MEDMISWMQEGGQVSSVVLDYFDLFVAAARSIFFPNNPNLVLGRDIWRHKQYQETKEYADENGWRKMQGTMITAWRIVKESHVWIVI